MKGKGCGVITTKKVNLFVNIPGSYLHVATRKAFKKNNNNIYIILDAICTFFKYNMLMIDAIREGHKRRFNPVKFLKVIIEETKTV